MGVIEVRLKVREKLERGMLPRGRCQVTWFGRGTGLGCEACDEPVTPAQIECECEHPRGHLLRFHRACFVVWDTERQTTAPA